MITTNVHEASKFTEAGTKRTYSTSSSWSGAG